MIARLWFFVAGVLVGAAAVTFFVMRYYDVRLVPTRPVPVVAPAPTTSPSSSIIAPPRTPSAAPPPTAPNPVPNPAPATSISPPAASVPAGAPASALSIPVQGVQPSELVDTYNQTRGGTRIHEALDIMAPRGREVAAVADGKVVKLFNSKQGGLTVYQFDPTERYAYYYAHLDRYAVGLTEGKTLKRGELIGYAGSTGNANPDAPHLHFAIFELGPEKRWWEGRPINPYPLLHGAAVTN